MKWFGSAVLALCVALTLGCGGCLQHAEARPLFRRPLLRPIVLPVRRPAPAPRPQLVLVAYYQVRTAAGPRTVPVYVRTCSRSPRTDPAVLALLQQLANNQAMIMASLNALHAKMAATPAAAAQPAPVIIVHAPAPPAAPAAPACPGCDCPGSGTTPPVVIPPAPPSVVVPPAPPAVTPPTPPHPAPPVVIVVPPSGVPSVVPPAGVPSVAAPTPPAVTRPSPPVVVPPGGVPPIVPLAEKLPNPSVEMRMVQGRAIFFVNTNPRGR